MNIDAVIENDLYAILKRFYETDNLKNLVLVGSTAAVLYRDHYNFEQISIKTNDIDFSVVNPRKIQKAPGSPTISQALSEMGYGFQSSIMNQSSKFVPLNSVSSKMTLSVEFMCEPGRHIQEPTNIKELDVSVTPLPYQRVLQDNISLLNYKGIPNIRLPKPEFWVAHKIALSSMRVKPEKAKKDLIDAHGVLRYIGINKVFSAVKLYPGKFEKHFNKGFIQYQKAFGINQTELKIYAGSKFSGKSSIANLNDDLTERISLSEVQNSLDNGKSVCIETSLTKEILILMNSAKEKGCDVTLHFAHIERAGEGMKRAQDVGKADIENVVSEYIQDANLNYKNLESAIALSSSAKIYNCSGSVPSLSHEFSEGKLVSGSPSYRAPELIKECSLAENMQKFGNGFEAKVSPEIDRKLSESGMKYKM